MYNPLTAGQPRDNYTIEDIAIIRMYFVNSMRDDFGYEAGEAYAKLFLYEKSIHAMVNLATLIYRADGVTCATHADIWSAVNDIV